MSDSYLYPEFQHCYEETKTQQKDRKNKVLKILVLLLSVVLVVEAIIYTVIMPGLNPVKVSFSGNQYIDSDKLFDSTGFSRSETWMSFDTAAFASKLSSNSLIESVSVEKRFPDQILVHVTERVAVASTLVTKNGKTVPVQIDKNGVVFTGINTRNGVNVPLITGLSLDSVSEGMRISSKYRSLLEQISEIAQVNPVYFSALSEIKVVPTEYGSYELMLYPIHSRTRILTDRTLNEESLQFMMVILDVIDSVDTDVVEVDMRYGTVSYKK